MSESYVIEGVSFLPAHVALLSEKYSEICAQYPPSFWAAQK
jgi:hypothetical protein